MDSVNSIDGGLLLEDGTWFDGSLWGKSLQMGEVVFNTSMTGYQEVLTDPSYCDQMIIMTYPLIGNYGVSADESEAKQIKCKGLIVKELFKFENTDNKSSLQALLYDQKISVLSDVDTRAIVKKIREHGTMKGVFLGKDEDREEALFKLKKTSFLGSVKKSSSEIESTHSTGAKHIALYDFGYKKSILDSLTKRNVKVTLVPHSTSFERLKELAIDGVVLSNGPGDPSELMDFIPTVKKIQENYPMLGICLGHQLFALANGAKTQKMHFGHRGGNHAVLDIKKNRCYLSSQNHGYDVDANSIDTSKLEITHENVNDKSVEGLKSKIYNAFSVQFHPEANPGPTDTAYIFDEFINSLEDSQL